MGKEFKAHEVVGLDGCGYVLVMDADCHSHEHMLRSFDDSSIHFEQVGPLESLKAEEVVTEVSCEIQGSVQLAMVFLDDLIDSFFQQRCFSSALIFALIELLRDVFYRRASLFA